MLKLNSKKSFLLILVTLLICSVSFLNVFAVAKDYDFTVLDWHSDISVGDNAKYHVKETISTQFFSSTKHGIFRTLPTSGKLERDGISSAYKAKVENISVTDGSGRSIPFSTSKEGKNLEIKIGDPDKYVDEYMTYVIEYDYDMFGDRLKENDEVYLNVLGEE